MDNSQGGVQPPIAVSSEQGQDSIVFTVDKAAHAGNLIRNLPARLLDASLLSEYDEEVTFHSVLLAAASPVLEASQSTSTKIPGVSRRTLEAIKKYLHQPGSFVEDVNWGEVLKLANELQMDGIVNGSLDLEVILDSMRDLYIRNVKTFLVVKADDDSALFPCHAAILAASSPAMKSKVLHLLTSFPMPTVPSLTLPEANMKTTQVLFDYIYSGQLKLHPDYVFKLLELALAYEYTAVARMCKAYIIEIIYPGCAVEFYHTAQDVVTRYDAEESRELVSCLHAWISLHFAETIQHPESAQELTESDWLEFIPWGYISGWQVDEITSAAVQWYKQNSLERTLSLSRVLACITALSDQNRGKGNEESEAIKQELANTMSSFISKWRAQFEINEDHMAAHRMWFQEQQALLQNVDLSEQLRAKLSRLQARHSVCVQEVQSQVEAERQEVTEMAQYHQLFRQQHEQMMRQVEEMKLHQRVKTRHIADTEQRLQKQEEEQQKEEEQIVHNQILIDTKKGQQKQQCEGMNNFRLQLVEIKKKQEEEEQDLAQRQQGLEDQLEQHNQDVLDLEQSVNANEESKKKQQEDEMKINQKQMEMEKKKKQQQEEQTKMKEKEADLKLQKENFEKEQKEFEATQKHFQKKKKEHQEDLKKNEENVNNRMNKYEQRQRDMEKTLKAVTDEKNGILERLKNLEKK